MVEQTEPAVKTEDMLQYLALDETPENNTVVEALIKQAEDIIRAGIGENLSASVLNADETYIAAVKALTASIFYDRSMSQGVPLGVKMAITILQGRYDSWPDNDNSGKD